MVAGQITRAMVLDLKYHHNYDIMMYPWHIYRAAKPKKTADLKILRFLTHFHFLPQMVMIQLKAFPYLSSLLVIPANQNLDKEDIKHLLFQGMGGLFLCHAGALVLGAIFTFVFVPETRNKSLTQLEQIFKKSGKSEDKV